MTKYIFITGGVVSSLGKGINAASIGQILKSRGLKVSMQKFDPYINVDSGKMSPYQHGEVFITEDGAETDLDLGHYERFIDEFLSKDSSVSTGKIYKQVIENERDGLYDGATIQVIPHITDEIKRRLTNAAKSSKADVVITEIGGTVGDIESLPYLEAIRQARRDFGYHNTLYIHNTLVPYIKAAKEIKTKPTQHSVSELKSLGIQPDILILRSEHEIEEHAIEKIALFTDLKREAIFDAVDVEVIYEPIINFKNQKIDEYILDHFQIENLPKADIKPWKVLIDKIKNLENNVKVAIVGKYVSHHDAYLSLVESLKHSGFHHNTKVDFVWIDAENVTSDNVSSLLKDVNGIVVPGGFGKRATEGKIETIKYARENNVPFLGICYGMQLSLVEYARNVLGLNDATSEEINGGSSNLIITKDKNFDTHLGSDSIKVEKDSILYTIYGNENIRERFRHSFSFNLDYKEKFLENEEVTFSAFSNDILSGFELKTHPWFISVQYHPEYLSRPLKPHPLFNSFIKNII